MENGLDPLAEDLTRTVERRLTMTESIERVGTDGGHEDILARGLTRCRRRKASRRSSFRWAQTIAVTR
jgi:hypothetical protein